MKCAQRRLLSTYVLSKSKPTLLLRIVRQNFFANVKALINKAQIDHQLDGEHHHNQPERDLLSRLHQTQQDLHAALCDSFDTPKALDLICALITSANIYINSGVSIPNTAPLEAIAIWVTRMLRVFGLGEGPGTRLYGGPEIGWGEIVDEGSAASADVSRLSPKQKKTRCSQADSSFHRSANRFCCHISKCCPNSETKSEDKVAAIARLWTCVIDCEMRIW